MIMMQILYVYLWYVVNFKGILDLDGNLGSPALRGTWDKPLFGMVKRIVLELECSLGHFVLFLSDTVKDIYLS